MTTIVLAHRSAKDLDALPEMPRRSIVQALKADAVTGRGDADALDVDPNWLDPNPKAIVE